MKSLGAKIIILGLLSSLTVTADAGWGKGGKDKDTVEPPVTCYPVADVTVISNTGVKSVIDGGCATASHTLDVPGTSAPWDETVNFDMLFAQNYLDATPPVTVSLASLGLEAGGYVAVTCIAGVTNAGGLPDTGCDGLNSYPPDNYTYQTVCNAYYPSSYVDPSNYDVYHFQIIASFATDAGVVVGVPFAINSKSQNVHVPEGATILQFGMNDCLFSDNSSSPLTVELKF